MKKVLALVIAVILLAAMTPVAFAAETTVYVSVSVDGKLEVAAQPVSVTDLTVNGVIKAAHAAFYSGGESGYAAGIDATYNMFLITQAWGVATTPFVIINGMPLGADPANPAAADVAPVAAGDNIIIALSSDIAVPAMAISMTAAVADGNATVTALNWVLDFTTFTYSSTPFAGAAVVDPATGASLGTTDAEGKITVPASGVAAIDGLAAIPVDGSSAATGAAAPAAPTAPTAPVAAGDDVTVYVTVSVEGVLQIAAQPVTVNVATIETAIIAAHTQYYSGGAAGFHSGINAQYNMYMIDTCWGVATTPYVIYNGTPLGADPSVPSSADTGAIKNGDNIVLNVSAAQGVIPVVALTVNEDGDIIAKTWSLDFTTFTYNSAPLKETDIVDAQSGKVLGTTNGVGLAKIKAPDCGVAAVVGLAAVPVGEVTAFTAITEKYVPPAHDYSLFGGPDGRTLLYIVVGGLAFAIPTGLVVLYGQHKELKNRGVKASDIKAKKVKR